MLPFSFFPTFISFNQNVKTKWRTILKLKRKKKKLKSCSNKSSLMNTKSKQSTSNLNQILWVRSPTWANSCKNVYIKNWVTSGSRRPTGELGTEVPPTSETTPLQSTAQCILPLAGSITRGTLRLVWLMALQRRSRRRGKNREPRRLSLSSKVLCSSSAKSFSEPMSRTRPRKLKRLAWLFLRGERSDPRTLRRDYERKFLWDFESTVLARGWEYFPFSFFIFLINTTDPWFNGPQFKGFQTQNVRK